MIDETAIPMSPEAAQELIHTSLGLWGMAGSAYKVLRHNENLACQVDDSSGNRHLLRICQPKTTALAGIQREVDAIESEMAWVQAIRRDTDLPLQAPVASLRGRYVEEVRHPEAPPGLGRVRAEDASRPGEGLAASRLVPQAALR